MKRASRYFLEIKDRRTGETKFVSEDLTDVELTIVLALVRGLPDNPDNTVNADK